MLYFVLYKNKKDKDYKMFSNTLFDNEKDAKYGLGFGIGDKAADLFVKWAIGCLDLTPPKQRNWRPTEAVIPMDQRIGRVSSVKRYLLLILLVTIPVGLMAQVQFEAKVSKRKLGLNERLRVDFEMNQDGDNFEPPSFDGFRVLGGPNQSISNSWINGKRTYSKTI